MTGRRLTCDQCPATFREQAPFVLHLLEHAGPRGVHTFELRSRFIGNPSQRVAELEAAGHTIAHRRERLRGDAVGSRYTLVAGPSVRTVGDKPSVPGSHAGAGHKNPWRHEYMCPRCAYAVMPTPRCPRGHQCVRGWSADFTRPVQADMPIAA